jgi:hypothetical protein
MPERQTIIVTQNNSNDGGCLSGCGTLLAVMLVVGLVVTYWYVAVPVRARRGRHRRLALEPAASANPGGSRARNAGRAWSAHRRRLRQLRTAVRRQLLPAPRHRPRPHLRGLRPPRAQQSVLPVVGIRDVRPAPADRLNGAGDIGRQAMPLRGSSPPTDSSPQMVSGRAWPAR